MVPSSLWGLVLFVVLLAPGLAYVLRHERVVPARSHTAFRESLRVIFVSVACLAETALLATAVRFLFPKHTPDVRTLLINPGTYWRGHHVQLLWWGFAFFVFATLLGAAAAHPHAVRFFNRLTRLPVISWVIGAEGTSITNASAWYRVFHMHDEGAPRPKPSKKPYGKVYVGAVMDDKTYIEGYLVAFNVATDEIADREILLGHPLIITNAKGERTEYGAHFTVISARHIVRLDVTHLKAETAPAVTQIPDASLAQLEPATEGPEISDQPTPPRTIVRRQYRRRTPHVVARGLPQDAAVRAEDKKR